MNRLQKAKRKWFLTGGSRIRWMLTEPGWQRLMLSFSEEDPLQEWKRWSDRVSRRLKARIPGNWKTRRGIKKRKSALMSIY